MWWTGTDKQRLFCYWERICNISLFCCSWIPLSHQFPLCYPMFGSGGILSSHQILNFAFAHIWPFLDQALLLCDYRYISAPRINSVCVIKAWHVVILIYHFYNSPSSLRAPGRGSGTAAIYGRDCWWEMDALSDFPSFQHLVLIFPTLAAAILSIIYHLLKCMGLFGGDV